MTQAAPPAETEVVHGGIVGITQKNADTWTVAVQPPGSQYSRNLWTKDQQLVGQLSMMIGQQMAFQCRVSHWTNAQNQPVRSLWINVAGPGVEAAAPQQQAYTPPTASQPQTPSGPVQQPQPQAQQSQPQYAQPQQNGQPQDDPKQGMIHRQTASKVAVHLMQYLPEDVPRTYDTFLMLCQRLVRYYDHGFVDSLLPERQPEPPGPMNPGPYGGQQPEEGYYGYDDDTDIPF